LPYEISDGYDEIKLDGKNFYVMNTKVQVTEENAMMQKYISTIEKGFALSYIVSYSEKDAEKATPTLHERFGSGKMTAWRHR
jgi:hypothetical protein